MKIKNELCSCIKNSIVYKYTLSQKELLHEDQLLRRDEGSGIQTVEVHTARETECSLVGIERHGVAAGFLSVVHECGNFPTKHIIHLQCYLTVPWHLITDHC